MTESMPVAVIAGALLAGLGAALVGCHVLLRRVRALEARIGRSAGGGVGAQPGGAAAAGVPAGPVNGGAAAVADERVRAAAEERNRIYSDLHDDIGAKLLTLVHSLREPELADLARSVLQDLRDIVSRSRADVTGTLLEVLAQIRDETEQRLALIRSELLWRQDEATPDPLLDEGQALHLFRIVREAVTNAIRHGQARRVRVRVQASGGILLLEVADDGPGVASHTAAAGRGMESMRSRAAELHGSIEWDAATQGGTKVVLRFPLPVDQDGGPDPGH